MYSETQRNSHKDILKAADEIAAAVRALKERQDALGTQKAFDPRDPQTNAAFKTLWDVSFERHYPPKTQNTLIRFLQKRHPEIIPLMRDIGHASEIEMEKGYARLANERALTQPMSIALRKESPFKTSTLRVMLAEAGNSKDLRAIAAQALQNYADLRMDEYQMLAEDFPYQTYEALSYTENTLASFGVGASIPITGTQLIIEAGALPETAIYSSITRAGGRVIAVISDKESFDAAKQLIAHLEERNILVKGAVQLVHADPLSEAFRHMKFTDDRGNPANIYSATITQLVQGKDKVERIAASLVNDHHINTIVVRGAHGLAQLLYEPLDGITMPGDVKSRIVAVPSHAKPSWRDGRSHQEVLRRQYEGYNTSHVYSKHWRQGAWPANDLFQVVDARER